MANDSSTVESSRGDGSGAPGRLQTVIQWVFPDTSGKNITTIADQPRIVGRDAEADTPLLGEEISRRHAEVHRTGPVTLVRDLKSKNGVYLNGEPIEQAAVTAGDVLRVGEWVGIVLEAPDDETMTIGDLGCGLFGGTSLGQAVRLLKNAALSPLPVVLVGETGTGKERFARALHEWSKRPGPFFAVNCANYSTGLAATELFGHVKGAFTGAQVGSEGHLRAARGGTLFLDEVAELPVAVQAQLLRVLEQREVLPVGGSKTLPVDVRFVCATQTGLDRLSTERAFRNDLRARLEGVVIELPALRQRREDIPALCQQFLAQYAQGPVPALDSRLVERLCIDAWPLNVRQLELLVQRLLTLFPGEPLLKLAKVEPVLGSGKTVPPGPVASRRSRGAPDHEEQGQLKRLTEAIERCAGNITRAAAEIGITRGKAYRLLKVKSTKTR